MNDKDERPLLQRRGGRRISMPSSPISPSLPKRNDRFYRASDAVNVSNAPLATENGPDQPTIDLAIPSPIFTDMNFASSLSGDSEHELKSVHGVVTEESDRNRNAEHPEPLRGNPTIGRVPEGRQMYPSRQPYLADMTSKSSPVVGRAPEGRERYYEAAAAGNRNYSTTSLSTDRSASDENVPTKASITKKSRLNMLNPMSLLARRRSSYNTKLEDMNVNLSPLQVPAIPDNFDPSIRGNFVHDFSTPRSKRPHFENSPRREAFSSPTNLRRPSDFGTSTQYGNSPPPASHSPMFKEHFQDDHNALQPGQTAYLHNTANVRRLFDAPSPATLPTFAQKLPALPPEPTAITISRASPPLDIPHPDAPPPPPPKRTPSPHLEVPVPIALPRHMTSVSSRFSFQIADHASSAQEKLLEDRHKEHFAKDAGKENNNARDTIENEYDDYDFEADDDFEEKIPGINTDFDDDDGFYNDDVPVKNIDVQSSQRPVDPPSQLLHSFHFTPPIVAYSPTSTYHASSEPTPRDNEGFAIGVADTKYSPAELKLNHTSPVTKDTNVPALFLEGLRINTNHQNQIPQQQATPPPELTHRPFDDNDLYFDDGEFDIDQTDEQGTHFDENLLDDESGPIRDIPAENAKRYEAALERSGLGDQITAVDPNSTGLSRDTSSSSNFVNILGGNISGLLDSREHELNPAFVDKTTVLTEDNLAAYHDALVEATHFAAANGKFNRQVSFSSDVSDEIGQVKQSHNHTYLTQRQSNSQNDGDSEYLDEYDTFTFDDDNLADDDLMIAEANAEALENDDDGFYGQEFGFYARVHGKDSSDQINGGFFAAHGSNGVKRSHSGKANFQEPSLTPITERSEWSTRNSVACLDFPGSFTNGGQPIPSPGLSQLLDSSSYEDEISLSALIKLRRGAFGGSSTSINSLGERSVPGSSPLAHVSSYSFPPPESSYLSKQSVGTSASIMESEEEDDGDGEQLTLTQNTPRKKIPGSSPSTPYSQMTHLSVTEPIHTSRKTHHRRNSSGAESVSYVRDNDGRWVLERIRMGDDGEQEIVEREYLAGARI